MKGNSGPTDSWFIAQWKERMISHVKSVHPEYKKDKIRDIVERIANREFKDRDMYLINNYRDEFYKISAIKAMELIMRQNLIIGGGSCLFLQHNVRRSLLIDYIANIMDKRNFHKKERSKYEKYSKDWLTQETLQKNAKIKTNSLYGVLGYYQFILYNVFLAEAVTNMGQHIITSASTGFENFLSDNSDLMSENQFYEYINTILKDCKEYKNNIDMNIFDEITEGSNCTPDIVYERLIKKASFDITDSFESHVRLLLQSCNKLERVMLYYKNNFIEFCSLPFSTNFLVKIFDIINVLMVGDAKSITEKNAIVLVEEFWKYIELFVFNNHPITDRIRKGKYTDRESVLYVDTDSNMVGLNKWVTFIKESVIPRLARTDVSNREIQYTAANLMAIYLARVVGNVLMTMCRNMNINEEYAKLMSMKNEFYFKRMLFVPKKKRYIALMILQEGILLNNGEGFAEIKGFDFIKATTKEFLKDAYTDLCLNDILKSNDIDVTYILRKVFGIRQSIIDSIRQGDTKFFKQSNVNSLSHYKKPYGIQGIKGVTLWNTVLPKYVIDLPSDVDIIPIKEINNPYRPIKDKTVSKTDIIGYDFTTKVSKESEGNLLLLNKYPEIYDLVDNGIWRNPNMEIAKMKLNSIAKPKNADLDLPQWYFELIDSSKIIDDAMNLIIPILQSLGIKITQPNSKVKHISNIVAI